MKRWFVCLLLPILLMVPNTPAVATVPRLTTTIKLEAGWNLISFPYYIENRRSSVILDGLPVDIVYYYLCNGTFSTYATTGPTGTLRTMRDGYGYLIRMNAPATLTVTGLLRTDEYAVGKGWNMVGFTGDKPRTAADYLSGTNYSVIYGYNNSSGYYQVEPNQMLEPGHGYWVAFINEGVIRP